MSDPSEFAHFTPSWARLAGAFELDESIAVAHARCRVAAAHGRTERAEMWADVTTALADVRRERQQLAEAVEDAIHGSDATTEEPPC